MRPVSLLIALLALPLFAQSTPQSQPMGRIAGQVVNKSGEPVPHAIVCWGYYNEHGGGSTCGREADDEGRFNFEVPLETNQVWGEKPFDGYWSAVGDPRRPGQSVSLTGQKPTARLVVKLGSKPGRISFTMVNKNTGAAIEKSVISVASVEAQAISTRFSANDQSSVPVPTDRDVLIMIEAKGYKRWFYMDGGASQPAIRLEPGEERHVEADLEPEAASN